MSTWNNPIKKVRQTPVTCHPQVSLQPKHLCLRQVGCFTQLILARVSYRKQSALHITIAPHPQVYQRSQRTWTWIVPASPCAKAQLVPRLQLPRAQNAQSLSHKAYTSQKRGMVGIMQKTCMCTCNLSKDAPSISYFHAAHEAKQCNHTHINLLQNASPLHC